MLIFYLSQSIYKTVEKTKVINLIPGLILTSILAGLACFVHSRPATHVIGSLLISIILGMIVGNVLKPPKRYQPGIDFSLKKVLKLSVILLGLKLSFTDVLAVGYVDLGITFFTISCTFLFAFKLGKTLGLNHKLVQLIAAGTSICGTSAIVATNGIVDASEEDLSYSVAVVTAFGTMAIFLYPLCNQILQLSDYQFGLWCGISIQQTAQVLATSFHNGSASGEVATVSKLARIIFLAPTIIMLGLSSFKQKTSAEKISWSKLPIPWFILLFLVVSSINTWFSIPENIQTFFSTLNAFLLAMATAAMGLETSFVKIKQSGFKPLYLAGLCWLFLSAISLILIKVVSLY